MNACMVEFSNVSIFIYLFLLYYILNLLLAHFDLNSFLILIIAFQHVFLL